MVQELEPLSMEAIGEAIADIVGELEPEEPEENQKNSKRNRFYLFLKKHLKFFRIGFDTNFKGIKVLTGERFLTDFNPY